MAFLNDDEGWVAHEVAPMSSEKGSKEKIAEAISAFSGSALDIEDLRDLLGSGGLVYIEDRLSEPNTSLSIMKSNVPNEFDFFITDENGVEKKSYTHRPRIEHPRE